jgi:hypothetical protein
MLVVRKADALVDVGRDGHEIVQGSVSRESVRVE